ncbi:hypothetical protein LOC67_08325 [Stieleria sp. JC731]|uniref:hypothetical protein n=1 Tax=Pirellulaceae TaxID=2691357 RepID=UPI001E323C84|nr:hypothetical protein [Stieleria sp. JC731]MCC9600564.1 hypothetical protein [Stieleria sp. JC731]
MKKAIWFTYLAVGIVICSWFTVATAFGWKSPSFGGSGYSSGRPYGSSYLGGGRSFGGSWGVGK